MQHRRPRPLPPPSPILPPLPDLPSPTSSTEEYTFTSSQMQPQDIERRIDHFLERFRRSTALAMEREENNGKRHHHQGYHHRQGRTSTGAGMLHHTSLWAVNSGNPPFRRSRSALSPISSGSESVSPSNADGIQLGMPRRMLGRSHRRQASPSPGESSPSPSTLMSLPLFLRRSLPAFYESLIHSSSSGEEEETSSDDGMDDTNSSTLSVRDVADLLYAQYALITGGKSKNGFPIITFPDRGNFFHLGDEDYRRLITYITSVPALEDSDLGFVVIVDRRHDKWNSVKTVLLKISGYFPGLIHVVYVLRPAGFFQKAISEVSNKLFKEEFKFRVVICNCIEDLHAYVDRDELTLDLYGNIPYSHEEWIEQRVAVERYSISTHEISMALRNFTQRLQETEFPNDVTSTEELLQAQGNEYERLKNDLHGASQHGETLLEYIRTPTNNAQQARVEPFPDKLINITAVERLLLQLEETEHVFDEFWFQHELKLRQCLELRKFEHDFRELQGNFHAHFNRLSDMKDLGDSVRAVDTLLNEIMVFQEQCLDDLEKAGEIRMRGANLLECQPDTMDTIQPKCFELQRIVELLRDKVAHRIDGLNRSRDLQERVEKANKWCTRGIDLLGSQQVEKCSTLPFLERMLNELDDFLMGSVDFKVKLNNPKEFRAMFQEVITPESKALVQQVLQRIDDVQSMCEKRRSSLTNLVERQQQQILDTANQQAQFSHSSNNKFTTSHAYTNGNSGSGSAKSPKVFQKAKTVSKMDVSILNADKSERRNSYSPDNESLVRDIEALKAKRGHVITELLETERIYVAELNSIIQGYKNKMKNVVSQPLLPTPLVGKDDILFGNLEEIYAFHKNVFLCDLENCIYSPDLIALCFSHKREEFHQLYSYYCQNHPQSEALRGEVGDQNPFFQECQFKLGHKLPLGAYLLKPVQRITKYQLLLKELIKLSEEENGSKQLQEALDCMLVVLKCVNDSMHQVAIKGFPGNLAEQGRLLLQSSFCVWSESKKDRIKDLRLKPRQRHIFLYTKVIVFCKKVGRDPDKVCYQYKHCLKMSQIGLTETVSRGRSDQCRFELWLEGRLEVHILQAPSLELKDTWVGAIKKLLFEQLEFLRGESKTRQLTKGSSLNGIQMAPLSSPPLGHRQIKHTSSWEYHQINNNLPDVTQQTRRLRLMSVQESGSAISVDSKGASTSNGLMIDSSTVSSYDEEEGWSTEYSNSEDEDGDPFNESSEISSSARYMALADYIAMDPAELSLHEGDILEMLKVGCSGWWFVRIVGSSQEGWAPATYLSRITKPTRSSPSVSSQDSGMGNGGLRRATSRTSVTSNISLTGHD